jgi:hypothetical protein
VKAEPKIPRYWRKVGKREKRKTGDMVFIGTLQAGVGLVWEPLDRFPHILPGMFTVIRYVGRRRAKKDRT